MTSSQSFAALWQQDLRIVSLGTAPRTAPVDQDATRRLEIFLDRLLLEASDGHAHLLDPDFVRALSNEEKELATSVRAFGRFDLRSVDESFAGPIRALLEHFGARHPGDAAQKESAEGES